MPATPHRPAPITTRRPARAGSIARPRTYEQPALADLSLNPRRGTYVLNLILQQHNWRHSSKHKGVSHKTIAERARLQPLAVHLPAPAPQALQARPALVQRPACRCGHRALAGRGLMGK